MLPSRTFINLKAPHTSQLTNVRPSTGRGRKKRHQAIFRDHADTGPSFVSSVPDASGSGVKRTECTIIDDIQPLKRTYVEDDDDEQFYFPEEEPPSKKASNTYNEVCYK